jgi:hypothetical protein
VEDVVGSVQDVRAVDGHEADTIGRDVDEEMLVAGVGGGDGGWGWS